MEDKKQLFNTRLCFSKPALEIAWFGLFATCIKLLLIPSYHSTDFEVHRNWLAVTHSLPVSKWYFDETSQWTLDYPPFFAYFEYFLSIFAGYVEPRIVDLEKGLNYKSNDVIIFQRMTVIASDVVLFYGTYLWTKKLNLQKRSLIYVLVIWSPTLLLVDHIHFQYNGFLLGLLLISLACLQKEMDLIGASVFAALLCFKHLFAVAAPIYFVYLLKHYCLKGGLIRSASRIFAIGSVVVTIFVVAFVPFWYHQQIEQVIRRMFPFGRGLCHAYWAPNFWVIYIIADKGMAFFLKKHGLSIHMPSASFTSGLVGHSSFAVLPQITPAISFTFVLLAMSPCLRKIWRKPQPEMVLRWVAYAYTCGFVFGWHVHEKASLHFVIPLAIASVESSADAKHYFLLKIVACYSLFPLIFQVQEQPFKILLLLLHSLVMWLSFLVYFNHKKASGELEMGGKLRSNAGRFAIGGIMKYYLLGIFVVETWVQVLHPLFLGNRLPFLPLMVLSTYCSFGIMYSWFWQLRAILQTS